MCVSEYQNFFSHNPFCCLYLIPCSSTKIPLRQPQARWIDFLGFVRECECDRGGLPMENEAYGAFVGIDVDSTLPVFTLGLIGGTEYMDADDSVTVRPRQGLQVFKRAVAFFKTRGVTEVVHCGNVIHSANAGTGTQFTALQDMETERGRLGRARWHFAAGPADVVNFSGAPGGVLGALKASRDESAAAAGRSYYAAFPAAQWRLLVRATAAAAPTTAAPATATAAASAAAAAQSAAQSAAPCACHCSPAHTLGARRCSMPSTASIRPRCRRGATRRPSPSWGRRSSSGSVRS
jgi:hypothetical protein